MIQLLTKDTRRPLQVVSVDWPIAFWLKAHHWSEERKKERGVVDASVIDILRPLSLRTEL